MPFSYNTWTGAKSVGDEIEVPFPFLSRDYVSVLVDGEVVSTALYQWTSDSLIECLSGFPSGSDGRVQRFTPRDGLPGQQQGTGAFDWRGANANDTYVLHIQQEIDDSEAEREAVTEELVEKYDNIDSLVDEAGASATAAATSETNAAASETAAAGSASAAATSETNAAASETAAAGSASAAATSESNSLASEVASWNNALDAAGSATTATTKASEAVTARDEAVNRLENAAGAVRWDVEQTLSDPEKTQARENLEVLAQDGSNATTRTKWRLKTIGEVIYVNTSLTGVEIPPADAGFIELTAGLDGASEYNEGKLTGETITGSGATLVATAVIDDAESPMNGATIPLINTEERVTYSGERSKAGDVFNDQMQDHGHELVNYLGTTAGGPAVRLAGSVAGATSGGTPTVIGGASGRTGDRTRAKGQFLVAFLKYKDVV